MTKTITILGASLLACAGALAQNTPVTFGDWRMDAPGVRHEITLSDLPAPLASEPKAGPLRGYAAPRGRRAQDASGL